MNTARVYDVRLRALCVLIAIGGGVVLAQSLAISNQTPSLILSPTAWLSLGCGLLALSIPLSKGFKSVSMWLCVLAISCGYTQLRLSSSPADRLDRIVEHTRGQESQPRVAIEVMGTLVEPIITQRREPMPGEPAMWSVQRSSTRLRLDSVRLSDSSGREVWIDASGYLKLIVPVDVDRLEIGAGDRVWVLGMYSTPGARRNLGDLDWASLAAQSSRVGNLIVGDRSMIRQIEHASFFGSVRAKVWRVQGALNLRTMQAIGIEPHGESTDELDDAIQEERLGELQAGRSMLAALLLGQRDPSFEQVYQSFQRVGVAHVLAISGFHLALVILMGVFLIRFIGEYPRLETAVVICILVAGMLVVPMRPPIVRAGVIVVAMLIASRAGRKYDRLTTLAWVGCGLLIWRPMDVFSLGYQLSMGITALLVMLSNASENAALSRSHFTLAKEPGRHKRAGIMGKLWGVVLGAIKINIACWIVAMPTIAYHVGIVSPLAPIVSLVLIPLVAASMVIGYLQIAFGLVLPDLASHTIVLIDSLAMSVRWVVELIDMTAGSSLRVPAMGVPWTMFTTCIAVLMITNARRLVRWHAVLMCSTVLIWTLWIIVGVGKANNQPTLRIDMLDVGDGTCFVLQSKGEAIVWDCGSLDRRVGPMTSRAIRTLGSPKITGAIVTHDNIDHFNGLIDLARLDGIENVYITNRLIDEPSSSWTSTRTVLESMGVQITPLTRGSQIMMGDVVIECLWPIAEGIEDLSANNTSMVVRINVPTPDSMADQSVRQPTRSHSVLLTGDIERPTMEAIMIAHPELSADILELPHHGSTKSGAFEFVDQLSPTVIFQSTGHRRLNNPHWDQIRKSSHWYTSAQQGGAWVEIDHDGQITHGWAWE